jgi:hypothetical protein
MWLLATSTGTPQRSLNMLHVVICAWQLCVTQLAMGLDTCAQLVAGAGCADNAHTWPGAVGGDVAVCWPLPVHKTSAVRSYAV